MAADVVRVMNGVDSNESSSSAAKSTPPVTRDFLSGSGTLHAKELDLDLQVPSGWEKRLDLMSGKVYLQRCNSSNSSSSTSETKAQSSSKASNLQDLNFPPAPKPTLNLFDDGILELKLTSSASASPASSNYQSVCTLDKVKSALERAEKETERKRSISMSKSSSPLSNSSCSVKDTDVAEQEEISVPFATACPGCFMYVLVSKSDPRCPRCSSNVPYPGHAKKPRIDLNMSI